MSSPRLALFAVACVSLATTAATAQPGAEVPPEPLPGTELSPAPTMTPRYAVIMTAEERELVLRGEISTGRYIAGGIVSYAAGFGIGHAVQGRWQEDGWIFTLGEGVSFGLLMVGLVDCLETDNNNCNESFLWTGLIGLAGFRIWELVDAWVAPAFHNRRVRRIRAKYNLGPDVMPYRARLHLGPVKGGGMTGGVAFSF